jgi:hypothetical protein
VIATFAPNFPLTCFQSPMAFKLDSMAGDCDSGNDRIAHNPVVFPPLTMLLLAISHSEQCLSELVKFFLSLDNCSSNPFHLHQIGDEIQLHSQLCG